MLLVTKNIIRRIFADIATAHWQINSFGYGELQELPQLLFDEDTQSMPDRRRYPILFVSPDIDTIQGKTIYYGYKIVIADLVRTGEQNETEVESDTFLIIQDVIAQIQDQDYGFLLDIDNIQIEPFTEKWTDLLTGHIATVRLKTAFQFNRCQIPSSFISISNPYIPLNEEGTNERDPLSWHKTGNTLTASSTLGSNNDQDWRIIHNNVTIATIQAAGLKLDVLNAKATAGTIFLTTENGVIKSRTAAEVRADIGAGTGAGTVTSVGLAAGTSGTDVNITGSPVTGAGNITINIPSASATARGLVTIASQTFAGNKTFNGQIILGQASLGMGQILFRDNTATLRHVLYQQGTNLSIFGIAQNKDELFINGASGNIAVNSIINTAKFNIRGDLNGNILYVDTSAGNQIFFARENGGVRQIGLYGAAPVSRATTAGAAATYVNNAGTGLTSTDTFDGYTLAQVVLALRNIGVLT